ncbi:MAG: diaminopimelate decarboxylase [Dehalococcoidia bacterium]|nr:diaminopimelate decarboxylase [Dehalococcoidia bacterium]MDZ4246333.1 diaminopimelate decarboxylase [Dehalococcoidia bacterium]
MSTPVNMPECLPLFPVTARIEQGHLFIGGMDTVSLRSSFGTPLYVFDEVTLRQQCRDFVSEFRKRYENTGVVYACKAFINRALAGLLSEEGLGFDVVSGGELSIITSAAVDPANVYFHGNNKSEQELTEAINRKVGTVVVDNFFEMELLQSLAAKNGARQKVLLRLTPGIDPHTHKFTTTGIVDSKFGFSLVEGKAEEAVKRACRSGNLNLEGLHFHLGSPIFETDPYGKAIDVALEFAARMAGLYDFSLGELSVGGGFAVSYETSRPAPEIHRYADAITGALKAGCRKWNLKEPRLVIEPGRAIVGRAGAALYTAGATKEIPGVRKYVSLDGGMGDNIRPALYGAKYQALVANKALETPTEKVSLAGKFCESGDILIQNIMLPELEAGDILAVPVAGAYCLSMSSNYNACLKPAVVMVKDGKARLIRRRESYEDLIRCDLV